MRYVFKSREVMAEAERLVKEAEKEEFPSGGVDLAQIAIDHYTETFNDQGIAFNELVRMVCFL